MTILTKALSAIGLMRVKDLPLAAPVATEIFAVPQRSGRDIVAGKPYAVIADGPDLFRTRDDVGFEIICCWSGCAHLGGDGDWDRVEKPIDWEAKFKKAVADLAAASDENEHLKSELWAATEQARDNAADAQKWRDSLKRSRDRRAAKQGASNA